MNMKLMLVTSDETNILEPSVEPIYFPSRIIPTSAKLLLKEMYRPDEIIPGRIPSKNIKSKITTIKAIRIYFPGLMPKNFGSTTFSTSGSLSFFI